MSLEVDVHGQNHSNALGLVKLHGFSKQIEIFKRLKFPTNIMRFNPDRGLIETLILFWDSTNNVFRFEDFELTLTLEEIGGFMGLGKGLHKKLFQL